jgi:hypothetical protein
MAKFVRAVAKPSRSDLDIVRLKKLYDIDKIDEAVITKYEIYFSKKIHF